MRGELVESLLRSLTKRPDKSKDSARMGHVLQRFVVACCNELCTRVANVRCLSPSRLVVVHEVGHVVLPDWARDAYLATAARNIDISLGQEASEAQTTKNCIRLL
eukprot:3924385-Amphidinium_carterae.1